MPMTESTKAGGIVVEVGTATVRMGPVGFALYAEEFYIAGSSIPEHSKGRGNTAFTPVPYYLMCRALELILKAYLLAEHRQIDELKNQYGHNLNKLWSEANKCGLSDILGTYSLNFEADLTNANSYYQGKAFEYFDFSRWAHGYEDLPPLDRFKEEIQNIIEKTKKYCFSVS